MPLSEPVPQIILYRITPLNRLRHTRINKRTGFAFRRIHRLRRLAIPNKNVQAMRRIFCFRAHCFIKKHITPAAGFSVKKRPLRNMNIHHFFKAQRLCTKLHPVTIVQFWLPALVFHRKGIPCITLAMKLHHIRLTAQAKLVRPEQYSPLDTHTPPIVPAGFMRMLMHDPSLGGKYILIPHLLKVNQGTLPLAEYEVLKR